MKQHFLRLLIGIVVCLSTQASYAQPLPAPSVNQQPKSFSRQENVTFSGEYLLYLPDDYGKESQKRWPLIVYLHGASARGENLELVEREGIPFWLKAGLKLPFIVVSPLCPAEEWWDSHWSIETLHALMNDVLDTYQVDKSRMYLTGWSMGGSGTWRFASAYPDLFAAIAPLCGRTQLRYVPSLKSVAVQAFHGSNDATVPLSESQKIVDALQKTGGDAQLTILDKMDHGIWESVYADPQLYEWFLHHQRK